MKRNTDYHNPVHKWLMPGSLPSAKPVICQPADSLTAHDADPSLQTYTPHQTPISRLQLNPAVNGSVAYLWIVFNYPRMNTRKQTVLVSEAVTGRSGRCGRRCNWHCCCCCRLQLVQSRRAPLESLVSLYLTVSVAIA